MAKRKRYRKPAEPDVVLQAKRDRARAELRAKHRADGIDPDIAEWGEDEVTPQRQAELEAKGVTVVLDQRRRMKHAHKADVWEELHARGRLTGEQLSAVRRLQDLMARRAGVGGRNEARAFDDVRIDEPLRDPCLVSDDMLKAGREMDLTLRLVGTLSCRLLTALLWPAAMAEPYDWREIVKRVTGETHVNAQAAPLRFAAQALADVASDVRAILDRDHCVRRERSDPQALGQLAR